MELIETLPASRLPNTISSTFLHIHHGLRALAPKLSHVTFAAQKSKPNRAVTHAARFNRCKCKHANPQALITFSLKPTMVSYSSGYCQAQSALAWWLWLDLVHSGNATVTFPQSIILHESPCCSPVSGAQAAQVGKLNPCDPSWVPPPLEQRPGIVRLCMKPSRKFLLTLTKMPILSCHPPRRWSQNECLSASEPNY